MAISSWRVWPWDSRCVDTLASSPRPTWSRSASARSTRPAFRAAGRKNLKLWRSIAWRASSTFSLAVKSRKTEDTW